MSDDSRVTESWITEESRINSSPGAAAALAALQADNDVPKPPIGAQIAALRVPTMLAWGCDDVWIPVSDAVACRAVLPESPLVLVRDAGHAPYFERPSAFVDEYVRFLDDPIAAGNTEVTV